MDFDKPKPRKNYSRKEVKLKVADYCAYQERSQQEVRDKLYEYGLHLEEIEEVISELIAENFINEERFAIAFIGGKFQVKKWGRIKILAALSRHQLSDYCIKKGLQEIDDDDYIATLQSHLKKKIIQFKSPLNYKQKHQLSRYVIQKGFEPSLVWEEINSLA